MATESLAEKYKCISRIDNDKNSTHGWEVRIRRKSKHANRFFSDSKFDGDPHQSLLAAMQERDRLIAEIPKMSRAERAELARGNNSSGIPGVSRTTNVKKYKDKNYTYHFWQAYWSPEPGLTKSVRFSVQKYGEKGARKRAIQARKQAIKELKENSKA